MKSINLQDITNLLRYDILTSTTTAGSGHPTSSLSAVELMTVLLFDGYFHYDFDNPDYIFNDRLIFSKGHASPLYFSLFHAAGQLPYEELMTLRKMGSNIEGHPTPRFKFVDVATGSLGQGLSAGLGMALGIKLQQKLYKTQLKREPVAWVLLGDSEIAEGQVWEAMEVASYYKVNNLIGILDVNRLGQRGETMLGWDVKTYEERIRAFGWNTIIVEDGNSLEDVKVTFQTIKEQFLQSDKPTMIIAKTKKGAGISSLADKDNWHGKPLPQDKLQEALDEIGKVDVKMVADIEVPEKIVIASTAKQSHSKKIATSTTSPRNDADYLQATSYKLQDIVATREAYGEALKEIASNPYVVVLDAETSNSTFAEKFKEVTPERFFEMYIAEQNMVSVALGMSKVGLIPFASTFAAFLSRAYDQIRMAQYSDPNIKLVGSHAGVSIGVDGSSQMALEDIAMMRAILESVVLYPSDATSTLQLVKEIENHTGLSYLRLTREKTSVIYKETESF
ncbi:MAG TPA: transketolase, partial [Candidatus Woesebacteria bacterium]|nr:transketolase [Candidatus Woesebacteria bacterium]